MRKYRKLAEEYLRAALKAKVLMPE